MAFLKTFQLESKDSRDAWGHKFQWTSEHLTPVEYKPLKYSYDKLAEDCVEILNQISPPPKPGPRDEKSNNKPSLPTKDGQETEQLPVPSKRDLFVLLRDNRHAHPKLDELWTEATTVPDWVDWDQVYRGQEVFYRYGGATLTGLAFQSLVGGMGANRVVETLARTGGFNVKVARHRLFETTQHILECTKSPESIRAPDGEGFASSLRVRLLHASVRQRIMKLVQTYPDYYDVQKNGVPINDLDCIATIATFSSTCVYLSLPRQGIFLTRREREDYIALWRLIAHYTGTPTSFFATPSKAKAIMESLLLNEVAPSPTSQLLANNVIRALENTPPTYASRDFLHAQTYWLNGPALSRALGIPSPPIYYYALIAGQCLFFMALCYTYRSVPTLDQRKIKTLRRVFWNVIVESREYGLGEPTGFEFKYVPRIGLWTDGVQEDEKKSNEVARDWEGVERRSVRTLVIATGVIVIGCWIGWKFSAWMLDTFLKHWFS